MIINVNGCAILASQILYVSEVKVEPKLEMNVPIMNYHSSDGSVPQVPGMPSLAPKSPEYEFKIVFKSGDRKEFEFATRAEAADVQGRAVLDWMEELKKMERMMEKHHQMED